MHVLELRSRSLGAPVELVDAFTAHVHDKDLAAHGIRLRTFVKDWRGEYVWTYLFAEARAVEAFLDHDAVTRRIAAAMTRGDVRRYEVDDRDFEAPVIILSGPRTGSTLLYEVLTNAGGLWSMRDESHHVLEASPALRPESRGYGSHCLFADDADPLTATAIRSAFALHSYDRDGARRIDAPGAPRMRFLEKTPRNCFRVPFLNALFPDALFVFLYRDPVENISSMMEMWEDNTFHRSINLPGWMGPKGSRWCMLLPPGWRELNGKPTAEIAAFQWKAANDAILDAVATLPAERWYPISYADLLADPPEQLRRLCAFARLPFDERFADSVSGNLPVSSRTLSLPSKQKALKNADRIAPVLPRLRDTLDRIARCREAYATGPARRA